MVDCLGFLVFEGSFLSFYFHFWKDTGEGEEQQQQEDSRLFVLILGYIIHRLHYTLYNVLQYTGLYWFTLYNGLHYTLYTGLQYTGLHYIMGCNILGYIGSISIFLSTFLESASKFIIGQNSDYKLFGHIFPFLDFLKN